MNAIHERKGWVGTLGAAGLFSILACGQAAANSPGDLSSPEAQQGYSLGYKIGGKIAQDLAEVDSAALARGVGDAIRKRDSAIPLDEMEQAIFAFETRRAEIARAEATARATANAEAGDAFRAQFAREDGTVSLENGLLYQVIEPGTGEVPEPGSQVTLHYRGSLVDGTELDDSRSQGAPITVSLDRVLPGWSAALERMPAGARWKVVIPPSLAYGESGAMGFVEPNSTLVFEFERVAS